MTRLRQNIAFDLDGVLVDSHPLFKQVMFDMTGSRVIDNGHFEITTDPPATCHEIDAAFRKTFSMIDDIKWIDGAVELLQKLYRQTGEPPLIVTARSRRTSIDTYEFLDKGLNIPFKVCFADGNPYFGKFPYLKGYDMFVDDRRKTVLELAYMGKFVYKPKREYNRMGYHVNVHEIGEVSDLLPIINELYKLDV